MLERGQEREPNYSGFTQEQLKRANDNRILFAKSSVSFVARGLWLTLFTRQRNTATGCFPSTALLRELAPGKRQGELYKAIAELESLALIRREPGRGKRCTTYHVIQPHDWTQATVDWLKRSETELEDRVKAGKQTRNARRKAAIELKCHEEASKHE